MKLNAASRLLAADEDAPTPDNPLVGVHTLLTERDIDNEFPDDVFNSLVITSDFKTLLDALPNEWTVTEREITSGGLYNYGLFMILERGEDKLKLLYTSAGRASLWLI